MKIVEGISRADGLADEDRDTAVKLMKVWRQKNERNLLREKYYLGHVRVRDLGIAMPKSLAQKIDPRIDWPRKAVHALADRSVLNGYTSDDEAVTEELRGIYTANRLDLLFRKILIC